MAPLRFNKASLGKERRDLKNYQQFLPSLDLKRRKLLMEKNKAQQDFELLVQALTNKEQRLANNFPMIAGSNLRIDEIIKIKAVDIIRENIVGVSLPVFSKIDVTVKEYNYFNTPHWLENFVNEISLLLEIKIRLKIAKQRLEVLERSLQIVTQRTNLFEKVLIPRSKSNIRKIQIFLTDSERASIVSSKIAKKKRLSE